MRGSQKSPSSSTHSITPHSHTVEEMGRPPCCDKVGIKKGPWTPEEDIILVSYIQEHGPGNWRSVPTNTGLLRCSKSCRLRWTNYLRPGIKRGNFTPHEEGMIIHLQALLGNNGLPYGDRFCSLGKVRCLTLYFSLHRWAAIASYLPQRTDNDIKNYWNTHLKKKIKKLQSNLDPQMSSNSTPYQFVSKSFSDRSAENGKTTSTSKLHQSSSVYASSAENISRLLEGWMRSSPKNGNQEEFHKNGGNEIRGNGSSLASISLQCYRPEVEQVGGNIVCKDEFESILSFDNLNSLTWERSSSDSTQKDYESNPTDEKTNNDHQGQKAKLENNPPLSFLENWLLDETIGQVEEVMELPSIF